MKNKMFVIGSLLLISATAAYGQESAVTNNNNRSDLFRANELSLDAFGTATVGQYTIDHLSRRNIRHHTHLGVGVGANYFFTRYIGIGGDAYSESTDGVFVDSAEGNLIGRLPIYDTGLAPYVFAGGGHQFDLDKVSFWQTGGGLEFRFCQHVGVFVDARWVLPEQTKNYGVGRFGLRYAF